MITFANAVMFSGAQGWENIIVVIVLIGAALVISALFERRKKRIQR